MPWKVDDEGGVVVENGNPIFVHPDGKEEPFNGDSALMRIGELKNEARDRRQKYSELKSSVQPFLDANITDVPGYIEKASEAMSLISTYKDKGTPGAEEIERIKQNVAASFESRLSEKDKLHQNELSLLKDTISQKEDAIRRQLVRSAFDTSEFLREKTHLIPDMAYDSFNKHFVVEDKDGFPKIFAVDGNGEKIFSLKGTSYADPHEAIEILVKAHPQRDTLLKSGQGGSGATGGSKSSTFTGSTIDISDRAAASRNIDKIARGEVHITK